jgi:hypothetical protein
LWYNNNQKEEIKQKEKVIKMFKAFTLSDIHAFAERKGFAPSIIEIEPDVDGGYIVAIETQEEHWVWEFDELDQFATYYLHEVYED